MTYAAIGKFYLQFESGWPGGHHATATLAGRKRLAAVTYDTIVARHPFETRVDFGDGEYSQR